MITQTPRAHQVTQILDNNGIPITADLTTLFAFWNARGYQVDIELAIDFVNIYREELSIDCDGTLVLPKPSPAREIRQRTQR